MLIDPALRIAYLSHSDYALDMFEIYPIGADSLFDLKPLFDRSAGYEVILQDEIEYFQRLTSSNGLYARSSQGQVVGFIRSFEFEPTWSLIEFYVDPDSGHRKKLAHGLFEKFQIQFTSKTNHRWRVDVLFSDTEMNEVVQDLKFADEIKVFRYFDMDLKNESDRKQNQNLEYKNLGDPVQVASVLSFLSPVSEYDAQMWMNEDQIRILQSENGITCAAHVFLNEDSAEIVRLSTSPDHQANGFGSEMVHRLMQEFQSKKIPKIFLKVEEKNEQAIQFYKKLGFQENLSRKQFWYSKNSRDT